MTRNDTIAQATPISNINLLASISPYSDSSSAGPDVDVYSMSATPSSVIFGIRQDHNEFLQPPDRMDCSQYSSSWIRMETDLRL